VRRKALFRRAKELREEAIVNETKRKERMEVEVVEGEAKFKEDNRDDIEAYNNYQLRSQRDSENGGDQDESGEKEAAPVLPVFNKEAFLANWLNANPEILIPEEPIEEVDNDWIMSQSELDYNVNTYLGRE